jgi:hypothetical protein
MTFLFFGLNNLSLLGSQKSLRESMALQYDLAAALKLKRNNLSSSSDNAMQSSLSEGRSWLPQVYECSGKAPASVIAPEKINRPMKILR